MKIYPVSYFRKKGKAGGNASAANMTPEARSERARKAATARWNKSTKTLKKGDSSIDQK